MRILYIADAIEIDGQSGGATHVQEVASGLKALGHTVRVIARARNPHALAKLNLDIQLTSKPPMLAFLAYPQIRREVRRFRPHAVMERFYNFAGAGVLAAHQARIPTLLEVNAPMIDPPRSLKSRVDRLLLGTMRRWAVRQARWSRAIVTPLATTVPPEVTRRKIHELPWGANVDHFTPANPDQKTAARSYLSKEFGLAPQGPLAVFLGSFRAWHGVGHFAEAARLLLAEDANIAFLAVGGGPELSSIQEQLRAWGISPSRFALTGPQPHDHVPQLLRAADIGVAPFDLSSHAPLREFGFYWSPLKVFEYMACTLPVVTINIPPLNTIVRPDEDGLLYPSGDIHALANQISTLAQNPNLRADLGASGRERVVAHYSWTAHCKALDHILRNLQGNHDSRP